MISPSLGIKSNIKIIYLFCEAPGKSLTRKEIQMLTKLANNPLNQSLKFLTRCGILRKEKRLYRLNFENEDVEDLVEFFKKERTKLKNLPYTIWLVLFDLTTKLISKLDVKKLYLFGSHAKLIAHSKSDIDIALVIEKREPKIDLIVEKIVSKIEETFDKKIQVHLFEAKEFKKKSGLVKEILRDSIKIIP
jgi:predicted nucleotidyltransferase